jgi:hypothetical protein
VHWTWQTTIWTISVSPHCRFLLAVGYKYSSVSLVHEYNLCKLGHTVLLSLKILNMKQWHLQTSNIRSWYNGMSVNMTVVWDMTACNLVLRYEHFGGTYRRLPWGRKWQVSLKHWYLSSKQHHSICGRRCVHYMLVQIIGLFNGFCLIIDIYLYQDC